MLLENSARKKIYLTARAPIPCIEKALELIQKHSETLSVLHRIPEIKLDANLRRKNTDANQQAFWIMNTLKKYQSRHGNQDFEKVASSFEEQICSLESAIFHLYTEVQNTQRNNDHKGEATFQDKEDLGQSFESFMSSSKTIKQNALISFSSSRKKGLTLRNMAEASSVKDTKTLRSVPGKIEIPEVFLKRGITDGINQVKGFNANQLQPTGIFMESNVIREENALKVAEKSSQTYIDSGINRDIFRECAILCATSKHDEMNDVPAIKAPQEETNLKQKNQEKKKFLNKIKVEAEVHKNQEHIIDKEAKPGRVVMPLAFQAINDNQRRSKIFVLKKLGMPNGSEEYARPDEIQFKENQDERFPVGKIQSNEAVTKATENVSGNSTVVKSSQKCVGTRNDGTLLEEYAAADTVASECTIENVPKPTERHFKISKSPRKKVQNMAVVFLQALLFIFV
jgi:uncharacterized protein YciU (UPF0263 family)